MGRFSIYTDPGPGCRRGVRGRGVDNWHQDIPLVCLLEEQYSGLHPAQELAHARPHSLHAGPVASTALCVRMFVRECSQYTQSVHTYTERKKKKELMVSFSHDTIV